jgi:hypothetical protein
MQLKKIVASIIQSHKNEVACDVKIMIDRCFAMMSEDILSAISEQSEIPKDGSASKYVDTHIHGSNVEATNATCNSTGHADFYTGPFHKSSGPIVMDDCQDPCVRPELEDLSVGLQQKHSLDTLQQEAQLVRPQMEDFLLELQQKDSLETLHQESPFVSLHLEDLSVGMQQEEITWCHLLRKLFW